MTGLRRKGVVLLSGGLDSSTVLAAARRDGLDCYALTVLYGQRHRVEIERALAVARALGAVEHRMVEVDLRGFGGSSLVGNGEIPKSGQGGSPEVLGDVGGEGRSAEIPSTYVPARNTVFLSLALAWAEALGAEAVYLGVNAVDYSGYPDCRGEFLEAFQRVADLGTRRGVEGKRIELRAPLLRLSKGEIVRLGRELGVDFSLTTSCYDPDAQGRPCGECDSCRLRARGFAEAGVPDPLIQALPHGPQRTG